MSVLDTLKNFEHTFTNFVAKEYAKFRSEEPKIVALGDRVFPYVKSATQIALSFESPTIAAAAGPFLDSIHAKLDTAASLLYDFGPNPTVAGVLATAQNDLGSFETTANITNTASKDAISKALSSLQAFVASVMGAIAATQPAA